MTDKRKTKTLQQITRTYTNTSDEYKRASATLKRRKQRVLINTIFGEY